MQRHSDKADGLAAWSARKFALVWALLFLSFACMGAYWFFPTTLVGMGVLVLAYAAHCVLMAPVPEQYRRKARPFVLFHDES